MLTKAARSLAMASATTGIIFRVKARSVSQKFIIINNRDDYLPLFCPLPRHGRRPVYCHGLCTIAFIFGSCNGRLWHGTKNAWHCWDQMCDLTGNFVLALFHSGPKRLNPPHLYLARVGSFSARCLLLPFYASRGGSFPSAPVDPKNCLPSA